ncbi:MAG: GNAT family N-acetyltransferase [Sphingobacteriales bacterium]|nr:GNAT family N-acetyltransferase [Sphingobacteriales bacterium]MBP9141495.1 GNAT family N-acetyltransferase [Chitinophagales bacterium]MDA0199233.1 GNAT family N-acetyltransferase [Bacteroidota bacterium]MBK6889181.1 GNAT family N-acetyltransferase [Sphingobacteriales bacterium]MBK7528315.1 GNAT family N-acetyltransferase [Sphingobacteriales bacterium]
MLETKLKHFSALDLNELYDALQLRQIVFVVEQNSTYLDADGHDKKAWHLLAYFDEKLVGYSRILPPGCTFAACSFGRVCVHPQYRGRGWGRILVEEVIKFIDTQLGRQPIHIAAETYLLPFYQSLGFAPVSEVFLDCNIPHIEMLRS